MAAADVRTTKVSCLIWTEKYKLLLRVTDLVKKLCEEPLNNNVQSSRTLIGYLLTCARAVAWRGSVQVPGSSLSHRLPALVAWLSFGLRGPGAVGRERLKRGLLSSK
jgi:cell division FtsZ-interacting protein ZapD